MRIAPAVLGIFFLLAGSGCLVVGATVAAVGAVAATTIKAAGKVTAATVQTTGRVASAAVTSSGEVTALSMETAAKLAKAGMVVVVDSANGATAELPWQQGMQLLSVLQAGNFSGGLNAVLSPALLPGASPGDFARGLHSPALAGQTGRRPNFIGDTPQQAAGNVAVFKAAKIFRTGRMIAADLRKAETAGLTLQSGDVVELRR